MRDRGRARQATVDALLARASARGAARRDAAAAAEAAAEAAAFRAALEQRLKGLEAELAELKTRINGLLFLAAGTVLAQVVLRLVLH